MIKFLGGASIAFTMGLTHIIIFASIILAGFIALYTLRSIGLYKLAKDKGLKCKLLAVFPLVWVYVLVRLIEESKFFGVALKKLAILFTIILSVTVLINLAYQIIIYYPVALNIFNGNTIHVDIGANLADTGVGLTKYVGSIFVEEESFIPVYFNVSAVNTALYVLSYVGMVFDLMTIFIKITLFINIFRKYWPQKMMLATILSVFVESIAFPIFMFIIRNKKPVNYEEYIRKRYQYQRNPYGAYGQGGPFGQGPYGQNPYNQNPYGQNQSSSGENPFGEFSDAKKVDPFEEFSNDKKEDSFGNFSKDKEDKND